MLKSKISLVVLMLTLLTFSAVAVAQCPTEKQPGDNQPAASQQSQPATQPTAPPTEQSAPAPQQPAAASQQPKATPVADQPAQPDQQIADQPAPAPQPIDPEIDALLDKVEQRGANLKSYQADMLFKQEQRLVDVVKTRHGNLLYQIDNDRVRFRIHFADLLNQDLEDPNPSQVVTFDEDYAFDGLWFVIRNARLKNIQKQEVCKTPAKKEEFRLGKGPFPLPFSIRKADVFKEFDVTIVPVADIDPKDAAHLMLKPKSDSAFAEQYVQLEIWISKQTFVPVQMGFEKDNREVTSIVWSNIILDQPIDAQKFDPGPAGDDWTVEQTPLQSEPPAANETTPPAPVAPTAP